jgi:deoxyribose-phosphate aldolase
VTLAALAPQLDLILLKADATREDVARLCATAREHGCRAVCVNSSRVALARHDLEGSTVKVIAAVAFPLGAMDTDAKRYETETAVDLDAHEVEVVLNHGWLKDGETAAITRELRDVVEAADERPVRLIIETSLLAREPILQAAQLAREAEVRGITLSAVFGTRELSPDLPGLVAETVGPQVGVKAFAHVTTLAAAQHLLTHGASLIGATLLPK